MSLTPKNWREFQHYSGRRPPWIKLHRSLLDDIAFLRLPIASRALAPLLWLLAAEYEEGEISLSMDDLAFRLRMAEGELSEALKPLIDKGFFIASELLAECKQSAIAPTARYTEKEKEKNKNIVRKRAPVSEEFQKFWEAYPKREGANPKATAQKSFAGLLLAGEEASKIIAATNRYAAEVRGKVEPRFIPMAVTWLRQRRWEDVASDPQKSNGGWKPGLPTSEELEAKYAKAVRPGSEGLREGNSAADSSLVSDSPSARQSEPKLVYGEGRQQGIRSVGSILLTNGLAASVLLSGQERQADQANHASVPMAGRDAGRH